MFGFLKKAAAAAQDFQLDVTLKDDMERAVYLAVSVAYADGNLEDQERDMLPKVVGRMFKNFTPGEVSKVIAEAVEEHEISPEIGFHATEEKLHGVESAAEGRKLFAVAKALAGADGEIEGTELAVIRRFAGKLGLDVRQVLAA
jgi:tellurite resistance protein